MAPTVFFYFHFFALRIISYKLHEILRQLAYYLIRFIENTVDLSDRIAKFEIEIMILKKAKDELLKVVGETSNRAEVIKKKIQDAEAVLKKFVEENVWLLGINKVLKAEVKELRA